jgi:transcriptional regulator with XRE-family HTH domain
MAEQEMRTIRALRQDRGWTQYELARRVGVHPQAVYLWESGRRTPQVPQLRKLGAIFGLCSDEIDLPTVKASRRSPPAARADASADRPADPDPHP